MTDWIAALLDPRSVQIRPEAHRADPVSGLALIIQGQLGDYVRAGRDNGWPALGENAAEGSDPGLRLLAALGHQLSGSADPLPELRSMAIDPGLPSDLGVAAAVICGMHATDVGRGDIAVAALQSRLELTGDPLQSTIVEIHLGLRSAERGDFVQAHSASKRAMEAGRHLRSPRRLAAGLKDVARRNELNFWWQLHPMDRRRFRFERSELLSDVIVGASHGLEAFLTNEFKRTVDDPGTLTVSLRAEDPVEAPLAGALLRSECLGEWTAIREARKRLGHYRLLVSAGDPPRRPDSAFHLLRRANDSDGLKRGGALYRYRGPLEPLRAVGESVLGTPWLRPELPGNLATLRESADTLDPQTAHAGIIRLIEGAEDFLGLFGSQRTESQFMSALSALLEVAGQPEYLTASHWLRELALGEGSAILLQPAARAVGSLPWDRLPDVEREAWSAYCAEHLGTPTNRRFIASAAATGLLSAGDEHIVEILSASFLSRPELDVAALLLSAAAPLPPKVDRAIAASARKVIDQIRKKAATGEYSLGSIIDPALMLAHLLVEGRVKTGWREVVDFVSDRRVAASSKVLVLDYLAHNAEAIPAGQRTRLAKATWPVRSPQLFLEPEDDLTGASLRLHLALGGMSDDEMLAALLSMSSSADRRTRYQAAMTLPFAVSRTTVSQAVAVLALSLTEDRTPEVRGLAGQVLPRLRHAVPDQLQALVSTRLRSLLEDPGAVVPRLVLAGLSGVRLDPSLTAAVERLRTAHLSARVRQFAQEVMGSIPASN